MDIASSVDFARTARLLGRVARARGLIVPGFRCPPRVVGADRTVRRRAGAAVVSVRVRDRPGAAVVADMIEGIVVVNGLVTPDADRLRAELWEVVDGAVLDDDVRRVA